jgi:hypothetical protein
MKKQDAAAGTKIDMGEDLIKYRLYADGSVYHQDEFDEKDNSLPYYDDYKTVEIPSDIVDFIRYSYE